MMDNARVGAAKQIVEAAIEIAKDVPVEFRAAAFSKVFEFFAGLPVAPVVRANDRRRARHLPPTTLNPENKRKPRASNGPKGLAVQLADGGFFAEPRTVEAVGEHISLNFARSVVSKDLSKALIRLVQQGRLRREKTEDGKLAYRNA